MALTLDQRIDRWERRQEALIASVSGLAEVVQTNQEMLAALMDWLQRPPSSDMAELIKALTSAVTAVQDLTAKHGADIQHLQSLVVRLPGDVARAVQTGAAR
jgi:formate dehydrogenase assembly factor FdhD